MKGKTRLTQRSRDCLRWVAEQLTVSTTDFRRVVNLHAQTKKHLGYDAVRMYLSRLKADGYIATKAITGGLPHFIYVTAQTIHELALPFPTYEPRTLAAVAQVDPASNTRRLVTLGKAIYHTDAINKARLYFEERYGDVSWRSERWIVQDEYQEPERKRQFRIDAQVDLDDKTTSVEVENRRKGKTRLDDILLFHLMTFEQTYYFCTNPGTYTLVKERVQELDPQLAHFHLIKHTRFM